MARVLEGRPQARCEIAELPSRNRRERRIVEELARDLPARLAFGSDEQVSDEACP
jgi:hypothetical protein